MNDPSGNSPLPHRNDQAIPGSARVYKNMDVVAVADNSCENDGTVGSTLSADSFPEEGVAALILDDDSEEQPPRFGTAHLESTLLQAYQRVQGGARSEIVVVHGAAGTGKTSLVETLRVPVCKQGGYYVSAKFEQPPQHRSRHSRRRHSSRETFHAITAAFSDLCDLVVQSEDRDHEAIRMLMRGERDKDESKEANVLMQFVGGSAVSLLCNGTEEEERQRRSSLVSVSSSSSERKRKQLNEIRSNLKRACRRLLRVLATPNNPVVLFLDNLHWADFASLDLIRYLIADSDSSNILFVFAFRNSSGASLMKCLCRTARIHLPQETLELQNLDETSAHQMVAQLLYRRHSNSILKKTRSLFEAVFYKTGGNPRSMIEYLEKLERSGVLCRKRPYSWSWDLQRIQQNASLPSAATAPTRQRVHPQLETCFAQLSNSYAGILSKIELANQARKRRTGAVSPSFDKQRARTDTH